MGLPIGKSSWVVVSVVCFKFMINYCPSHVLKLFFQVRAIYPYIAQGPDELSLHEGDVMELSSGQMPGDGWWEGNSYSYLSKRFLTVNYRL